MTTPSPFQVARETATNLSSSFKRVSDENAIEKILSQAMNTGNPEILQNSIGKILSQVSPERQGAAVQYLQNSISNIEQRRAAKEAGYTHGAPPQVAAEQVKAKAKLARLSPYGLGGGTQTDNSNLPTAANGTAPALQGGIAPQANQPPPGQSVFRNLTDDELILAQGHPDREISESAKGESKRRIEERKLEQKNKILSRDEELAFHKESQTYEDDLFKQSKIARSQVETISNVEKALASGNINPGSLANIFKGFGKVGDKISEALINKDQATLLASIPQLLEGWKDVFGVRLSDADLKLLQDKLPSIGKTPEANRAIVKVLKKYADMTLLRAEIAREIKENNKGLRPLGYRDQVEMKFEERIAPVKVISPNNGRVIEIPAYKVSEAILAGGKLAPTGE